MDQGLQSFIAFEKSIQIRQPLHFPGGDFIQGGFHAGSESGIHQIGEVLLKQRGHSKGCEAWGERIVVERGIATIHDRADDAGVGGRTTDPFFLQHFHQGGFAEASRRLGLVSESFNLMNLG